MFHCFLYVIPQIGGQTRPHDGKCHLAPNPNFGGGQFRIPHLLPDVLTDHFPALQQVSLGHCVVCYYVLYVPYRQPLLLVDVQCE